MAGWTDFHDDWSSPDKLRLVGDALLEACSDALQERLQFMLPANQLTTYIPDELDNITGAWQKILSGLNLCYQEGAFNLGFANHTYNGGILNNADDIPLWTRETIATAAGLAAYPDLDELRSRSAEFVHAIYTIINLITVFRRDARQYEHQDSQKSIPFNSRVGNWGQSVTIFNAQAWSAWLTDTPPSLGQTTISVGHSAGYDTFYNVYGISRRRLRWRANSITPQLVGWTNPDELSYQLSVYAQMGEALESTTYVNNDYLTDENKFAEIHEGLVIDSGPYGAEISFADINDNNLPEPDQGPNNTVGWVDNTAPSAPRVDETFCLFDFEVTGGFDFVSP